MIKKIANNKIMMITHIADIDGVGSLVLAQKHYKNLDYVLCELEELREVLTTTDFSNYEIIYLCDLAINKNIFEFLNNHPEITTKLKYFDHHEKCEINVPSYVNSCIEINGIPTCGTELFYNYLVTLDDKFNCPFYKIYVEATREQDNYSFTKEEKNAKMLAFILELLGPLPYIDMICSLNDAEDFKLPKFYSDLYQSDLEKQESYVNTANNDLLITNYKKYKIGVTIKEQYRSIVGNKICKLKPELDFIMIINFSRNSVSLRSVKDNVDLNQIGREFHPNGGGHKSAAGFLIDRESIPKLKEYINLYLDNLSK
jgi:uncharacterized protein